MENVWTNPVSFTSDHRWNSMLDLGAVPDDHTKCRTMHVLFTAVGFEALVRIIQAFRVPFTVETPDYRTSNRGPPARLYLVRVKGLLVALQLRCLRNGYTSLFEKAENDDDIPLQRYMNLNKQKRGDSNRFVGLERIGLLSEWATAFNDFGRMGPLESVTKLITLQQHLDRHHSSN
ncbi:hypothetical protein J6590_039879 [Homalodisca vitripennis]|nr:hypothetical protein J6590_039879 [Homalodisca vitripennis]